MGNGGVGPRAGIGTGSGRVVYGHCVSQRRGSFASDAVASDQRLGGSRDESRPARGRSRLVRACSPSRPGPRDGAPRGPISHCGTQHRSRWEPECPANPSPRLAGGGYL